jgi:hypothetical protein
MPRIPLGRYGFSDDVQDDNSHFTTAPEIERLGFGTLWITGGKLDRLSRVTDLLEVTDTAVVGSAIIPPDMHGAAEWRGFTAAQSASLRDG